MKALDHRGEIQTMKSRKNSPAHALQLKYQNYCGRWDGKKKKKRKVQKVGHIGMNILFTTRRLISQLCSTRKLKYTPYQGFKENSAKSDTLASLDHLWFFFVGQVQQ